MRLVYYDEAVIEHLAAAADLDASMTVADVGTGTGFVAAGLASRVARVIGIDNSAGMLAVADRTCASSASPMSRCAAATSRPSRSPTTRSTPPSPTWSSTTPSTRPGGDHHRRRFRGRPNRLPLISPRSRTRRARKKDWRRPFLAALRETGMVAEACKAVGIGRRTAYDERQRNEEFALAWADVLEESTEDLEQVAVRRAKDGSDTLLIFLLKARRPEVYRERYEVRREAIDVTEAVSIPSDRERALEVAKILHEAGALRDPAGIEGLCRVRNWRALPPARRKGCSSRGDGRRALGGHDE